VVKHRGGVLRILLVEDEPEMAAALGAALKNYDMVVDHFSTLADAEEAVSLNAYGAILLDRQLPDGDGLTLIPMLRAKGLGVPVIVLTARGDLVDRVAGLNGGADDYLGKPFAVEELLARLRAVLRRPADMASETITLGRLCFDFGQREACVGDEPLDLPRRELLVLETLLRRMGRTVARSSLEEAVYGIDDEIQSNALDTHVSRLRRKLSESQAGVEIHAIRGVGYLLKRSP
jgi:DNA-binding response OmpR family regulator